MRLQNVHLRVNDAETGQPTPCRIHITDPAGQEYAPLGRPLEFSCQRGEDVGGHCRIGKERWFSIDGACEIALPPGELQIQVRKGINYSPLDQVVNQPQGKMAIRLVIQRQHLTSAQHQLLFDTRCHFSTPHATLLDAAAEGLTIANLLAEPTQYLSLDGNTYSSVPNLLAFSGQKPCLQNEQARVIVNTHHRHPVLGSLGLLHCHRVVHPLQFGGAENTDDWSLRDWVGQCHRKGGFVVWTEPFAPKKPFAGEALALAILGEIDAYELTPDFLQSSLRGWYQLLDAGIDLPLVGGSGRYANDRPVGGLQTATYWDGPENDDWRSLLKYGSGKVTNGPVPNCCFDEQDTVYFSGMSLTPFQSVQFIANGEVVAQALAEPAKANQAIFVANGEFKQPINGWVAARVIDAIRSPIYSAPMFGHTSAMRIGASTPQPRAVNALKDHLDRSISWVETHGRFEQPKFKQQLLDTFAEAKAKLMSGQCS